MKKLLSEDRKGVHNLLTHYSCPLTPCFFAYDNQRESHAVMSPCRQKRRKGKRKTSNKTNLKEIVPYTALVEKRTRFIQKRKQKKYLFL